MGHLYHGYVTNNQMVMNKSTIKNNSFKDNEKLFRGIY